MRNACWAALAALTLFAGAPEGSAQVFPNGLYADSVNPELDAAIIKDMRAKMDSIHRNEHRPTIALVLSGGGAKGASQVGVVQYILDMDIPIDMICGTSIGGLIGGLVSVGYKPEFIQDLFLNQDWSVTLTDKVDRKYYSFLNKLRKETYVLSIPFHYTKSDFEERIKEQSLYATPSRDLSVDNLMNTGKEERVGVNSLMNSLPAGYVYGFNVNNLLSSLTVGYHDNMSFKDLPIPFFCVSADLLSCKAKNWGSGQLKTAMRSTMSIPGLFNPVRTEGMVLVDGGIRNNFPIDLARAMGADLVIGVDLSDQRPVYSELNSIGSFLGQFIRMLGQDSFQRNVGDADVFIKPDTRGYNMLSFTSEAIDTLVRRGYAAARSQEDKLREIKSYVKDAKPHYGNVPATNLNETKVQISAVIFEGVDNKESKMMQRKINIKAGSYIGRDEIDEAMQKVQATGCFESVTYSLLGKDEPYRLVFDCRRSPVHQFGFGLRMDTDEWASAIFNLGFNTRKLRGSKLDFNAKVGLNHYADLCYSLDLTGVPTINLDARIGQFTGNILGTGETKVKYHAGYWTHQESIYLSNIRWTAFDFQIGLRNRFYSADLSSAFVELLSEKYPVEAFYGNYGGFFGTARVYTMDRMHYPSKGVDFFLGYDLDIAKSGCESFVPISTASMDFRFVIPFGQAFAIIPDLHLRSNLADGVSPFDGQRSFNPQYSLAHCNYVGGAVAGRNISGQIPFVGFNNVYFAKSHLAVINVDMRVRPMKNLYISAMGGYINDEDSLSDMITNLSPTYWGAALEFGYTTPVGPIKIRGNWANLYNNIRDNLGFYLSFGYDF